MLLLLDASITPVPTEEPATSIEQRQLEPEVAGSSPEEDTKISIPEEMPKDVVSLTQQQTIISLSEEAPKEQEESAELSETSSVSSLYGVSEPEDTRGTKKPEESQKKANAKPLNLEQRFSRLNEILDTYVKNVSFTGDNREHSGKGIGSIDIYHQLAAETS